MRGIHTHDVLSINDKERLVVEGKSDNEEHPEYFIIRADNFTTKDIAPNWMEQWMNY